MSALVPFAAAQAPDIDWAGLSPFLALFGGMVVVLMVGLAGPRAVRHGVVPALTVVSLLAAAGLTIWQWGEGKDVIAGALRIDDLALAVSMLLYVTALAAVALSIRAVAPVEAGHGEYYSLLLAAVAGMTTLAAAQNLVSLFLGLELLSVALYIMCATELHRRTSVESGLKYLIVGSLGSATLLYGLALVYGATGSTDFDGIARAIDVRALGDEVLLLTGVALVLTGLAFKASIAPFHQWTPDVYEGAPTPITAFMAVATKAAAFAIFLRFFDVAVIDLQPTWGPALAALATISIVVGNVGALGQSSLKRLLAWSSIAQAGYLLAGVVVSTRVGLQATVLYLGVYLLMNLAAFAVVVARERESPEGDDIRSLDGLGATRPWLAWPMTIAMLSLAGIPATAGFVGKFYLISATIDGYAWLGVVIVLGSAVSLAYYLRVVAAMWMRPAPAGEVGLPSVRPAIAGAAPEGDGDRQLAVTRRGQPEATAVAVVCGAASLVFGILPGPLFDAARDAGRALFGAF